MIYSRTFNNEKRNQKSDIYVCNACPACDKQTICTKGKCRQINVEKREWLRKQIRENLKSVEGQIKYKKRMLIESIFGVIKHNLNYLNLHLLVRDKITFNPRDCSCDHSSCCM